MKQRPRTPASAKVLNNRLRDAHRIEVSFPEAHIADSAEPVPAPRAGFFGIAAPGHLAGIAMGYQVAQKLHACTDPDDPPEPPLSVLPAPNCLSVSPAQLPRLRWCRGETTWRSWSQSM